MFELIKRNYKFFKRRLNQVNKKSSFNKRGRERERERDAK
jgi:hypothetical protein